MSRERILVVDDQEAKRYLKSQVLRRAGFEVMEAGTGGEALALARAKGIAAVVLDVNLPDMSGLEVCRILKHESPPPTVQVLQISQTAVADSDRVRGLNSGADVYLLEPVAGEVLVATVRALIRVRDMELALAAARDREAEARREAEHANHLKDDFLAMLSHELRTPLNVMAGSIWRLRQSALAPDQAQAIDALDRSTRAQTKLINDLLDISRIVSGKLEIAPAEFDLDIVTLEAVENLRHAAERKGISIETSITPTRIVGDAGRLDQVVSNLLNNAVQHTPAGGRIHVSLNVEGGAAVLAVRDNGEGIEPDVLPHVFTRFRQGERGASRTHTGLGLGLAIVRDIVRLHKGTVDLDSGGRGKGTAVTVRLPMAPASSRPAPAPAPAVAAALGGVRVLLVEDDDDSRGLMSAMLKKAGAETTTAASVTDALTALGAATFDVLVSDIAMPFQSGYDLIRLARAGGHRLPALAVTASSMPDDRARVLASGFNAHLGKPLDMTSFTHAIAALTQR
jgi:signal transduction histidine kinase